MTLIPWTWRRKWRRFLRRVGWTPASTWWVDESSKILATSNPTNRELQKLRKQGFSTLLCLLDTPTTLYDPLKATLDGWRWTNIPIPDYEAPTLLQVRELVELFRSHNNVWGLVIHCEGGSGRTGTAAAIYRVAVKNETPIEALTAVRISNSWAIETEEQYRAVIEARKIVRAELKAVK